MGDFVLEPTVCLPIFACKRNIGQGTKGPKQYGTSNKVNDLWVIMKGSVAPLNYLSTQTLENLNLNYRAKKQVPQFPTMIFLNTVFLKVDIWIKYIPGLKYSGAISS